jgi:hypothetical protein
MLIQQEMEAFYKKIGIKKFQNNMTKNTKEYTLKHPKP